MKKGITLSIAISTVIAASFFIFAGCNNESPLLPASQTSGMSGSSKMVASADPAKLADISKVMKIQDKYTQKLMEKSGIVGTATGLNENGEPVVLVFTKSEKDNSGVPKSLDGTPVVVEVTGEFHALDRVAQPRVIKAPNGGSTTISHTAKQMAPIKLGTSGGWTYDLANGYCCGGTLGSVVMDIVANKKYILSNYHVFRADIVAGDNYRIATVGDPIIQPGLIDVNCTAGNAQVVATLAGTASLPNSNVDASIAEVAPGMVSDSILEIGMISKSTVSAAFNQPVKKSGRTTRLTRSTVSGLNATISVVYDNECAGGTAFTKKYTGQIVIKNSRNKFLNGGDSGSLLVEDKASNPRAIGLLFAGSSTSAIANPINEVLNFLGPNFAMAGN